MKTQLQTAFSTRQYMLSKDFELYYYSDRHLKPVGAHTHSYYEFYFFMEGVVDLHIGDQIYGIKPGDFVLIPPNTRHYPVIKEEDIPYRRFVLWISSDYCSRLLDASTDYGYVLQYAATTRNYLFDNDQITFNAIQSMIFRLIEETKSERFGKAAEVSLQINSLLLYLNRLIYERNHPTSPQIGKNLYRNLCDYISDHLEEELSLDQLAKEFFVSKYHISHIFKDNIGISIHQYIIKKRLNASKDAILSGVPISKIYEQYGFHDYSSFYRAFKKEYGLSPKEYKEMYQLPAPCASYINSPQPDNPRFS